ncbi:protein kinase C-binding protein NELL1-like isoform X2 [Panulirus ornatus]|uniref:protein kinase C-binding protein NELL1-like isoform X2 n=1 Tax=Panulirus ornatus TaxID=150431 RepID=UPI003A8625B0
MRKAALGDFPSYFLVILVLFSAFRSSVGSGLRIDQCMDQKGQVQMDGAVWIAEGCRECMCMDGSVMCHRLEVDCPPRPMGKCVEIHGPCCPEWDCAMSSIGCQDPQGMLRDEGELWSDPSTPCTVCSCHEGIVECLRDECSCDPNCNLGCIDHQGAPRNEGEMWRDPMDPCTSCSCEFGMVSCYPQDCPPQIP